jgi:phenylacetate-CoA ligase
MIEPLRTWMLLKQLRSHVHVSPQRLKSLQDSLFREALLHAYEHVPFYRRYWDQEGFDPQGVRGTQDLERVPIMTRHMAHHAVAHGELLARNLDATGRTYLYTTGSSGHPLCITRGEGEERLWRTQGLRIWFEHGFRWRHKKAQFDLHAGTPHLLQRLGISRTRWISPDVPVEELRDRFLEAQADWVIITPTVLRRLAGALAVSGGHFPPPRAIFCQGELVDKQTRDLSRRVFGLPPVDLYTLTEVGYVAWQCERRESLHVNADTHLVEVLRNGEAVHPGGLGKVAVTDLCNRAMPFLRYDTGDLAIAGNGTCGCGRQFPSLQSIEGRQRDAIQLKDGRIITSRSVVDHLAPMLPTDAYRLHQETTNRFRLEFFSDAKQAGDTATHPPTCLPKTDVIVNQLRALLGDVEISIQTTSTPRESGEKTYPVVVNFPVPVA